MFSSTIDVTMVLKFYLAELNFQQLAQMQDIPHPKMKNPFQILTIEVFQLPCILYGMAISCNLQ